jgi:amino acid transporter
VFSRPRRPLLWRLARRIPESGGEYIFLSRTLHPSAGYLAGWISLLVGFSAPLAAAALAFGAYAGPWMPAQDARVLGTVLILLFGVVHALHVGRGAQLQNWSVILKVCLILALIAYALPRLDLEVQTTAKPVAFSIGAFAVSLVWISFSYSGWNAAVYVAGEVKERRTRPAPRTSCSAPPWSRSSILASTRVRLLRTGRGARRASSTWAGLLRRRWVASAWAMPSPL